MNIQGNTAPFHASCSVYYVGQSVCYSILSREPHIPNVSHTELIGSQMREVENPPPPFCLTW